MSGKLPSIEQLPLEKVPHAIDFIGTGTFQVSQLDVLQRRSVELNKSTEANLSARGLHHRSKDHFAREVRASSAVISQALLQGVRDPKNNNNKSSFYLKNQYFQRALGHERLGEVEKAIEDYGRVIAIDDQCSAAYFNRGGLLYSQGKYMEATADLDKAIEIEPSKSTYHSNRAILYRRRGMFNEATSDTLVAKNIQKSGNPERLRQALRKQVSIVMQDEDPMISYLKKTYSEREECQQELRWVIDFLKSVRFFSGIAAEPNVMRECARRVKLECYEKDDVIFYEGDPGKSFYIIADGEVSVVKQVRSIDTEKMKTELLVKLFRGQTFGETALDNEDGKRTAGAIASQRTNLLVMGVGDYKRVFADYRLQLRNDIRDVLSTCTVFSTWEPSLLDQLADHAIVQTFAANSVLTSRGVPVKRLYIIKRGVLKITKDIVPPPLNPVKGQKHSSTTGGVMSTPGLWVLTKNWKDRVALSGEDGDEENTMTFTVGVLGSGQVFGELAVLSPDTPSPTSAVSFTSLEVYCFESEFLLSLGARFNVNTMNVLNESLNLYNPPVDKISHYHRSSVNWENKKKKILNAIERERPSISGKFGEG